MPPVDARRFVTKIHNDPRGFATALADMELIDKHFIEATSTVGSLGMDAELAFGAGVVYGFYTAMDQGADEVRPIRRRRRRPKRRRRPRGFLAGR